jgi:hypothetical protein
MIENRHNVLLAHAKEASGVEKLLATVRERLAPPWNVVLARDDFRTHYKRLGSWRAWTASVPQRYELVVVPLETWDTKIGKGTAGVVRVMLAHGLRVEIMDGARVQSCTEIDPEDEWSEWTLSPDVELL